MVPLSFDQKCSRSDAGSSKYPVVMYSDGRCALALQCLSHAGCHFCVECDLAASQALWRARLCNVKCPFVIHLL
eukprot:360110-Karenia_brevis.AAC.2